MFDPSIQMPEKTILTKPGGLEIELLNYGATLRSIRVPVAGKQFNVLLSYPADEDYLKDQIYLGSTLGRYAGRIDSGVARLKGRSIQLVRNEQNSGHCLHGGSQGFCLEFQDVFNEPNMDGFPSMVLRPGEVYRRQITLEFESESGLK